MKRYTWIGFCLTACLLLTANPLRAGSDPPSVGAVLPDFSLPVPADAEHRDYLGLSQGDTFKVPQVRADVVLIEIFSMYCPYCQREAEEVNALYRKIEQDPALKGRIKIIGIGAGNSAFEVDIFRKKYHVPFPLFSDDSFSIHKCIGEVRTPYFIGVKILQDGGHRVFLSRLGGLQGVDPFLESVIALSGLNKEE
jgi:peroxiredoxin